MNVTTRLALRLVPADLVSQPLFLCIDDTMVSKFGKKFKDVSKLFDHAAHNGSNYLNGHCFVSLMLCVPVWNRNRISYLAVPLGYRMWQKKESKLELASAMVRHVMPAFPAQKNIIILCDSWYVKQNLVSVVDEYENLDLIDNARSDSVIYDLPPARTGNYFDHFYVLFNIFIFIFCEYPMRHYQYMGYSIIYHQRIAVLSYFFHSGIFVPYSVFICVA